MPEMALRFQYLWEPVLSAPGQPYLFPNQLTGFARAGWSGPAIYRWLVFQHEPGDTNRLYIGETTSLSRRIYQYLNPGPTQQTNLRMRALFDGERTSGFQIMIEALRLEMNADSDMLASIQDLGSKFTRRMLENLFALFYSENGYAVLNA